MRSRSLLLAAVLVLPAEGLAAQAPTLVPVGGHRLEVLQLGSGRPTIVLEGGLGNPLTSWQQVWPDLAKLGTVVAYSRAGIGASELGPQPHTAGRAVEELHALLGAMHLTPPYVLVGKSYGGILVRLFVSRYPGEVAGLVLVDASHEQQVRRWGAIDSSYPGVLRAFVDSMLPQKSVGEANEWKESLRIQEAGSVEGMTPLPDIPIAVLTAMKLPANPRYINQKPEGYAAWRAMHEEWVARSHNALHIVTDQSGHGFEEEHPELVVEAVRFVLARIAGGR